VRDGPQDHAALRTLHALDLASLRLDGEVLVQDADPPSRAIVMAVRLSVTESMAALTMGISRSRPRQSRVFTSTSFGSTSL